MKNSRSIRSHARNGQGFTLVEMLAAMLFMAIVIPVALQGLMIANRAGIVAHRKREASLLADRVLAEAVITESWQDGDDEGDFGEAWEGDKGPRYKWTLQDDAWDVDTMRLVTAEVLFMAQGQEYSVSVSTLVPEPQEIAAGEEAAP